MALRRTVKAALLAVLVAVLAHAADFGSGHVAGGRQGAALLHAVWAALALLGFSATISGALGPRPGLSRGCAGRGRARLPLSALALSLGGFAAFCGIEALEGHVPSLEPALILYLPAAAVLVAVGSRLAGRWLAELGAGLAAWLEPASVPRERGVVRLRPSQPIFASRTLARGARRGRAPPFAER